MGRSIKILDSERRTKAKRSGCGTNRHGIKSFATKLPKRNTRRKMNREQVGYSARTAIVT